jgi:hypothetical protein
MADRDPYCLVVHTPSRQIVAGIGRYPVRAVRSPVAPAWIIGLGWVAVRINHRGPYDRCPARWRIRVRPCPLRVMPLYRTRAQLRETRRTFDESTRRVREHNAAALAERLRARESMLAGLYGPDPDEPEDGRLDA